MRLAKEQVLQGHYDGSDSYNHIMGATAVYVGAVISNADSIRNSVGGAMEAVVGERSEVAVGESGEAVVDESSEARVAERSGDSWEGRNYVSVYLQQSGM